MSDELERIWKEAIVDQSSYCSDIFMEELRKTKKNLDEDSRCPGRDSNRAPHEHE
jgi:hypothetical protein